MIIQCFFLFITELSMNFLTSGPGCSKLITSLVNETLNFKHAAVVQNCQTFFSKNISTLDLICAARPHGSLIS